MSKLYQLQLLIDFVGDPVQVGRVHQLTQDQVNMRISSGQIFRLKNRKKTTKFNSVQLNKARRF
jgi:hypothetical protein